MKDYATLAIGYNKTVRVITANTTNLCETARQLHGLWPTSAQVLSRALTITSIMTLLDKYLSSVSIKIESSGSINKIITEGKKGIVRGYLNNPEVFLHYNNNELNIKDAVGSSGAIYVTKKLANGTFYTSSSELVCGEIASDFTYYFASSEQTPSSVSLGAIINTDNSVLGSCGFLIQLLPGAKEETISLLEKKISNIKSCSEMINENYSPEDMIKEILDNDYQILENYDLKYECNCSKERFYQGIKSLGKQEITSIINDDKQAEVICNFCQTKYHFDIDDLNSMLKD